MIRIAGLDSGKQRDQTCLVSLLVNTERHEAFVEGCKFWKRGTEYEKIEEDVARLHIKHEWAKIMVEVNNVGEHVYESLLRNYGLPVKPVVTVHKLSGDRVKKNTMQRLRRSMPKNEMVLYYLKLKLRHKMLYPAKPNRDMQQLIKQMAAFREKKTESGNVTYSAPGNERDDGPMALLMALFEARPLLEEGEPSHVGGSIRSPRTIMEAVTADDFR